MVLHFLFSIDSGVEVIWITDMLSQSTFEASNIGMPVILNLCQTAFEVSIPASMQQTVQNIDVSMVKCFLEYQLISYVHINHELHPRPPSLMLPA